VVADGCLTTLKFAAAPFALEPCNTAPFLDSYTSVSQRSVEERRQKCRCQMRSRKGAARCREERRRGHRVWLENAHGVVAAGT